MLTIRVALQFAAALRLRGSTRQSQAALINSIIHNLGLGKVGDNLIGGRLAGGGGLSGGEKKRAHIGQVHKQITARSAATVWQALLSLSPSSPLPLSPSLSPSPHIRRHYHRLPAQGATLTSLPRSRRVRQPSQQHSSTAQHTPYPALTPSSTAPHHTLTRTHPPSSLPLSTQVHRIHPRHTPLHPRDAHADWSSSRSINPPHNYSPRSTPSSSSPTAGPVPRASLEAVPALERMGAPRTPDGIAPSDHLLHICVTHVDGLLPATPTAQPLRTLLQPPAKPEATKTRTA